MKFTTFTLVTALSLTNASSLRGDEPRALQGGSTVSYDFNNGACRTTTGESGQEGSDYERYRKKSYDECTGMCTADAACQAVEYHDSGHCEVWWTLPTKFEYNPGYNCFLKQEKQEPKQTGCTEVHRRPFFGPGDDAVTVSRNDADWKLLAQPFGPFGYAAVDPAPGETRKWRIYAIYWDENAGGKSNVQIKFDMPAADREDPVFTLPRVAGGWGWRADGYSDWYQFGTGTAAETDKSHAKAYVQLDSTAPYNNHGRIHWAEMVAYDCYE